MPVLNRRDLPRYAFFAERVIVEQDDFDPVSAAVTGTRTATLHHVLLNASTSGMGIPCPQAPSTLTLDPKDRPRVRITCQVYGTYPDGTPGPNWTIGGEVMSCDQRVKYFGVSVDESWRPQDVAAYKEFMRFLAGLQGDAPNPMTKDVAESIGVLINTAGVGVGICALVFPMPVGWQRFLLVVMIVSIVAYIAARGARLWTEWRQRRDWLHLNRGV